MDRFFTKILVKNNSEAIEDNVLHHFGSHKRIIIAPIRKEINRKDSSININSVEIVRVVNNTQCIPVTVARYGIKA